MNSYKIIKKIAEGGMGIVYLAQDEKCQRNVALKVIKKELLKHLSIKKRFLSEAIITAKLSHPTIPPVYDIYQDETRIFYTMPFIKGRTLKQILRQERQKQRLESYQYESPSISFLVQVFLSVCQGIAYAHSKNILHRDIKPENILIGNYGQITILDWGLACLIDEKEIEEEDLPCDLNLTRPGKVVGTLAYMAPERILDQTSSVLTEIYALGVIFYEILSLKLPFKRKSIDTFKKTHQHEYFIYPQEASPYRQIPNELNYITAKCLDKNPQNRFQNVNELIEALINYQKGESIWLFKENLTLEKKEDWEIQENILLTKHLATHKTDTDVSWGELMLSKHHFSPNIKILIKFTLKPGCQGFALLINTPSFKESLKRDTGYKIWLGVKDSPGYSLSHDSAPVILLPDHYLDYNQPYELIFIKEHDKLQCFLNGNLIFSYLILLPVFGSQIGLILKDNLITLSPLLIYEKSENVNVSCLAIPNSFLAYKDYPKALLEFKKISQSFKGRAEGWEAIFKGGLTLIEQSKRMDADRHELLQQALQGFNDLHNSPCEPLEYIGKSMAYYELKDFDEEFKSIELALRKYPNHPLYPHLLEHAILRLHKACLEDRKGFYQMALICLRLIPDIFEQPAQKSIFKYIQNHQNKLFLFGEHEKPLPKEYLEIEMAFSLAKIPILLEMSIAWKENASLKMHVDKALYALKAPLKDKEPLFSKDTKDLLDLFRHKKWSELELFFNKKPKERIDDNSPLFYLYGCFLAHKEGEQRAFSHLCELYSLENPKINRLISYQLQGLIDINETDNHLFFWERQALFHQLSLFHFCLNDDEKAIHYEKLADQETADLFNPF